MPMAFEEDGVDGVVVGRAGSHFINHSRPFKPIEFDASDVGSVCRCARVLDRRAGAGRGEAYTSSLRHEDDVRRQGQGFSSYVLDNIHS